MKILILTQVMDLDDSVLGFFHRWVVEFAGHCEQVSVVCLKKGRCELPENVRVFSLGKELQPSRVRYVFNFFKYIFLLRDEYDVVFVHMNYEYVLLGGVWWRLMSKKIGLWYAHGATSRRLRLAEWFSDVVFTSTEEGFRLVSDKKVVVGQGIDTTVFKPADTKKTDRVFTIVTVGRISRVKNYELLIDVARELKVPCIIKIIGGPITDIDREYETLLRGMVLAYHLEKQVVFTGPKTQQDIIPELQQADLFVSMSETGSLDKAVLEAMAVAVPVVSSNDAVRNIFGEIVAVLFYKSNDLTDFRTKIEHVYNISEEKRSELGRALRDVVIKDHTVSGLIERIVSHYR